MTGLLEFLAELYKTSDRARHVAERAGLCERQINFSSSAEEFWASLLDNARLQKKIDSVVAVACSDYCERADELKKAVLEYTSQNPDLELVRDTNRGFVSLAELIRQPGGRDRVIRFQVLFQNVSKQIEVVHCYKTLHDELHTVEFQCHNLVLSEVRRVADQRSRGVTELSKEVAWEVLDPTEINLRHAIDCCTKVKKKKQRLPSHDTEWITELEQAWQVLKGALSDKDIGAMERACSLLGRVICRRPAQINDRMIRAASDLRLSEFVQELERIHQGLVQADLDPTPVGSLGRGIKALRSLDRTFGQLIEEHNQWQDVDWKLRHIYEQRLLPAIIDQTWPEVMKGIDGLCGTGNDSTYQQMRQDAESFDLARAQQNPDPSTIERYFNRYRQQAAVQFLHVDKTLKHFLTHLIKIAGPISAVLEAMGGEHP